MTKDLKNEKLTLLNSHLLLSDEVGHAREVAKEKNLSPQNLDHNFEVVSLAVIDALSTPTFESFSLQDDLLENKLLSLFEVIDFIHNYSDDKASEEKISEEALGNRITEFFDALLVAGEKAKELESSKTEDQMNFPNYEEGFEFENDEDIEEYPSKLNVMYAVDENGIHELTEDEAVKMLGIKLEEPSDSEDEQNELSFIDLLSSLTRNSEEKISEVSKNFKAVDEKIDFLSSLLQEKAVPAAKETLNSILSKAMSLGIESKLASLADSKTDKENVPGSMKTQTFNIPGLGNVQLVSLD
ncbi:hypothetical protein ACFC9N_10675 [Enterococcus casseliflavus]|uniref:hypothetical protein n=1 Tax=Enterococcus TaxID=1350 RepID=UPI000A37A7D1|nr:hypothetical protein [Enterococcus sp. 4E1_DIV0656]OTO09131.1 hypothetical protein A5882_003461 [Enterococcus sp. 4E1_DIV0656]